MIYYRIPYNEEKRLDIYYNHEMDLLPNDDDWCCFLDGDAVFLTPDFGHQIQQVVEANPKYGLLTCMTNRVGTPYQCVQGMWNGDDIAVHRNMAIKRWNDAGTTVVNITKRSPISGVMILFKKVAYLKSGGATRKGILGVDNSIHYNVRNAGIGVGLMKGIYVYHWYRGGNKKYTKHLR